MIETNLVHWSDPILKEEMPQFDFSNPQYDPIELSNALIKVLQEHNALGVSANQLGLRCRVFALKTEHPLVVFNPTVVDTDGEILLPEGCLSFPGAHVKVKRPDYVRARMQGPTGEMDTKTFMGLTARAFLHELDHLNGVDFLQRTSEYYRGRAFNQMKKYTRLQKNVAKLQY